MTDWLRAAKHGSLTPRPGINLACHRRTAEHRREVVLPREFDNLLRELSLSLLLVGLIELREAIDQLSFDIAVWRFYPAQSQFGEPSSNCKNPVGVSATQMSLALARRSLKRPSGRRLWSRIVLTTVVRLWPPVPSTTPSRVAPIQGMAECLTWRWTSRTCRPLFRSYQDRLSSSLSFPSCTMRLPDRSSGSPPVSRQRRMRTTSSFPMMTRASEPPTRAWREPASRRWKKPSRSPSSDPGRLSCPPPDRRRHELHRLAAK